MCGILVCMGREVDVGVLTTSISVPVIARDAAHGVGGPKPMPNDLCLRRDDNDGNG